jgi:hypothetical protein
MLLFGVTITATVPQGSEIPEGLMNNPVYLIIFIKLISQSLDRLSGSGSELTYLKQVYKTTQYRSARFVWKFLCMLHIVMVVLTATYE